MRVKQCREQRIVHLVAMALLVCGNGFPFGQAEPSSASEQESLVFRPEDVQWTPPAEGTGGFPKGIQTASLGIDPVSGGETYYARFAAGSHFEVHWHTYAEYAAVLSGKVKLTLGTERYSLTEGDYVIIPAKMHHEWKVDAGGQMLLLVRRDGPADFNFVKQ